MENLNTATTNAIKANNGTEEQLSAFDWLFNGSRENISIEAVKAFYHIGSFMIKLDTNNTQKDAKAIREQYFEGKGHLSRNDYSACKQISKGFMTCNEAVNAYIKKGMVSVNASRIWATLKPAKKVDSLSTKIEKKIKGIKTAVDSTCKLIEEVDGFSAKLAKMQSLELALIAQLSAVRAELKPMKNSEEYHTMVAELAGENDTAEQAIVKMAS